MPILLIIPVFSTLLGGLLTVRFRSSAAMLMSLGAGLLLGAAFLDLLPEALSLSASTGQGAAHVLGVALASFFLFFAIQSCLDSLASRWGNSGRTLGRAGAAMLIFHSLRDGMAIGVSYAASHPAGCAVAMGIAAHDLGDGMNTVLLTTHGENPNVGDYLFLVADSIAPLAGGLLTIWCSFSVRSSVLLLAVAAGFFIQTATSDFLPEVRRSQMLPAAVGGAAFIYFANALLGQLR